LNTALTRAKCDDYTILDVYHYIEQQEWDLFVAERDGGIVGAATVAFLHYPQNITAFITAVSGRFVGDSKTSGVFFDLLRARGATRVQGAARPSIVRLWRRIGLEEKYAIVEGAL
jgi:hypothetical protein